MTELGVWNTFKAMPMLPQLMDELSERIFEELRVHKAMPFLQIAAFTDVPVMVLTGAIKNLETQGLATVKGADPLHTIVSISGKYY